MKKRIAIDVVLLPPPGMMDFAIRLNKELLTTSEQIIVLNKKTCIPHISLAMGCIREDGLPAAVSALSNIAQRTPPFALVADASVSNTMPNGERDAGLIIKKTPQLQSFHENIMQRLRKCMSYDVKKGMLFTPPAIGDITLHWIRDYAKKHGHPELFKPHITIGIGEARPLGKPIAFTASTLALCHLGNYCLQEGAREESPPRTTTQRKDMQLTSDLDTLDSLHLVEVSVV